MRDRWKRYWPAAKVLLTLAILFFVGRSLARDLADPQLWRRSYHPGWLLTSALLAGELYLLGLAFPVLYWGLLLREFGQHPTTMGLARGYYIGMLGKYAPGKAWALILRASLVRNPAVRVGVAAQTAFFEVLITMASGAVLAAILFLLTGPVTPDGLRWSGLVEFLRPPQDRDLAVDRTVAACFAAVLALPLLAVAFPPVCNWAVQKMTLPFRRADGLALPRFRMGQYFVGLAMLVPCWMCLGASFWIVLSAILPQPLAWSWENYGYLTAATATAYVAGFVILVAPSGLGVRELLLVLFLRPVFGGPTVSLAVLVIRLVWTAAELLMAGGLYALAARSASAAAEPAPVKRGVP